MNCYNGEQYLKEALGSVIKQTYENWELIFWDNQSTDKSASIFKSYTDSRFKYYYAPIHIDLGKARKNAIEKTTGFLINYLNKQKQLITINMIIFVYLGNNYENNCRRI